MSAVMTRPRNAAGHPVHPRRDAAGAPLGSQGVTPLFLSRLRLKPDASRTALRVLMAGLDTPGRAQDLGHRLIWTLFGDHEARTRDFLWRAGDAGSFTVLSSRTPEDREGLFAIEAVKPFAPVLQVGDRLDFVLRANPTTRWYHKDEVTGEVVGTRVDVVMEALYDVAKEERAWRRQELATERMAWWLEQEGTRSGFTLATPADAEAEAWEHVDAAPRVVVESYRQVRIPRRQTKPMSIGVVECSGTLVVQDPALFVASLGQGFGRARAFGYGLMLVRRAK
jgi:CRISPR system Cascade subunit CasE